MKPRVALTIAILILGIGAGLNADDFWKKKPYTEWTAEEVLKIIMDSPWARRFKTLSNTPIGARLGASGSGNQRQSEEAGSGRDRKREVIYIFRWSSSLAMRQAMGRLQVLQGQMTEQQVEQALEDAPLSHVIMVLATNPRVFRGVKEEQLREETVLRVEKREVSPDRVELIQEGNEQVMAIVFHFPREVEGRVLISDKVKSVRIKSKINQQRTEAKFDLKKMRLGNRSSL